MSVTASDQAVLLTNLGTPDAATAAALRPWLAEFLGDPRVVDMRPRWLWRLILHAYILRTRPAASARLYEKIWTEQGSPLRVHSQALARALDESLRARLPAAPRVALAMRYGAPSIHEVIARLQADGVRRLLLLPLYPQYSASATGSVLDAAALAVQNLRWPPELRVVNDYHRHGAWLDALAASVRAHWQQHGRGERLLMSFHGIPQRHVQLGDPYLAQTRSIVEALRARLVLDADQAPMAFQSRVGREPWLQPYTDEVVRQMARDGVRRLDVLCPGFAVDCLETLEEITLRNGEYFRAAGGEKLRYIPALNASPAHAGALAELVIQYTRDWREPHA